jgi:HSP20 family protein
MSTKMAQEKSFGRMVRTMARMMDQMQKGFCGYCPGETWTPAANVYESESAYVVCVDLAGVDKDKIDISVVDGVLRLRGQRNAPLPQTEEAGRLRVHLMEIDHGNFCREVEIPSDVRDDQVSARHENGLLWIVLPRQT